MPPTQSPEPIPWWQSAQLRAAMLLAAPFLLRVLRHFNVLNWFFSSTEDLVDWATALLALGAGIFWAYKRVQAGKNAANDTAPIAPPVAIVKAVTLAKRLTR